MIQQQCYTRERRGLFRNSEGYDSIAKSAGVEDAFIKDTVHPYCSYNASRALQAAGAAPEDYPKALTLVRCPDGRVLFGQAAYVGADFTGQRSTFFVHNYLLPEDISRRLDLPRLLYETYFPTGYDIAQGKMLPELSVLPVIAGAEAPGMSAKALLEDAGVDRDGFTRLVYCLLQSASGPKKTYIMPPVEPQATTAYAKRLLTALCRCMPPAWIRQLGFTTYSREPENKKGLQLLFLEKGVVRPGDPRVSRDFPLDFDSRVFPKTEGLSEQNAFADFLWEYVQAEKDLEPFYTFTETFPLDFTARHWDCLADMYRVYTNLPLMTGYAAAKRRHIFRIVREYLPRTGDTTVVDMPRLAMNLVLQEAKEISGTDYPSTREIMEEIAGYYAFSLSKELVSQTMYRYAIKSEAEHFFTAHLIRETDTAFLMEYVTLLAAKRETRLLNGYFDKHIQSLSLPRLFEEMRFWIEKAPDIFYSAVFMKNICVRVRALMDSSSEMVSAAAQAYQALKNFHQDYTSKKQPSPERFILSVMDAVDAGLLPQISPDTLTETQLMQLPGAFLQRGRESATPEPFLRMEILKRIVLSFTTGEAVNVRYLLGSYKLNTASCESVILRLRVFYRTHFFRAHFENIVFLFRNVNKAGLNADGLLAYAEEYGGAQKGEFLVWTAVSHVFNPNNEAHITAVKWFIRNNIKDNAFKDTIYDNAELKILAREVRFGRLAGMM